MSKYIKQSVCDAVCLVLCAAMLLLSGCTKSARDKTTTAKDSNATYAAVTDTQKFVQKIKCGWNLGNTFEATGIWGKDKLPDNFSVNDIETGWGNPTTTKAMFDKVVASGFNAVRIPVSWYTFVTKKDGKYTINDEFLKRVKEVVDYAHGNGMYVILDMHHDDRNWLDLSATDAQWAKIKDEYGQLWQQIATYFKDYDEKLLLEGANEVLKSTGTDDKGNKSYDWWGQTDDCFDRLNELYKIFADTVRATGGNNKTRYLVIPTYGAQWYKHQLEKVEIPNSDGRIIVDIHWYTEDINAEKISSTLTEIYDYASYFGMAVILGECGYKNSNDDSSKVRWAENYIKIASNMGLRCFLWDDGGNYAMLNRNTNSWHSESFVKAIADNAVAINSSAAVTTTAFNPQ